MRAGGGKAKGSQFERLICKQLSLVMSGGERQDLYWRSAMSGGRATILANKGPMVDNQAGDISSISPVGSDLTRVFFLECKTYKTLDIPSLLYANKGNLAGFWAAAKRDAYKFGKRPLLIAKENRRPIMVCVETSVKDWFGTPLKPLFILPKVGITAYNFESFCQTLDLAVLKQRLAEYKPPIKKRILRRKK